MARHYDQYTISYDEMPPHEHSTITINEDEMPLVISGGGFVSGIDYSYNVKSNDYSEHENRIKELEDKMDLMIKKLKMDLPSCPKKEFSNWQEFLDNLGIQSNEDVIFLLEQNFNMPTSKKALKKNDNDEVIVENKNTEYLLNMYGYDSGTVNNYNI